MDQPEKDMVATVIKRRIAEVLSENPDLNRKVSQELNIAIGGTTILPTIESSMKAVLGRAFDKKELLAEICLYRIIYSNPDLKAEFEKKAGWQWMGNTPPLVPSRLVGLAFNKREMDPVKNFLICNLVGGVLVPGMLMVADFPPWMGFSIYAGCVLLLFLNLSKTAKQNQKDGSICCVCELSSNDLTTQRNEERMSEEMADVLVPCNNCHGTAVCRIGCETCCPFVVQREDVTRRANIQKVLDSKPELKKQVETKIEDSILELACAGQSPSGLTPQQKNDLILKVVDNDPILAKEIEAVLATLTTNGPEDGLAVALSGTLFGQEMGPASSSFGIDLSCVHAHTLGDGAIGRTMAAPNNKTE